MIADFATLCTWVYVLVDDTLAALEQPPRRGPAPACSDSEVITIVLVSEFMGWRVEQHLAAQWAPYRALFPHFPSRTRLNRRRRALAPLVNWVRHQWMLALAGSTTRELIVDSFPVEVVGYHRYPRAGAQWSAYGANVGRVRSKRRWVFGYRVHLLITREGLVIDFVLAGAAHNDMAVAPELLAPYSGRTIYADKGYISRLWDAEFWRLRHSRLHTPPRANQRPRSPLPSWFINRCRKRIETTVSQLTHLFDIEHPGAHTFFGLAARLIEKLTALTCFQYIAASAGLSISSVRRIYAPFNY